MKILLAIPIALLCVSLASVPLLATPRAATATPPYPAKVARVVHAASPCITGSQSPGSYSAKVCISAPANGATLTRDAGVTVTVTVTGNSPGVQHVAYYLDGKPLLEDFTHPYTFSLPSNLWADGPHTLSAEALLRDGYTTPRASISVVLQNGNAAAPGSSQQFQATTGMNPPSGQPFVVAAVGDGAGGDPGEAEVVSQIATWNPDLFLYLGDVYERGTPAEFYNWYRPNDFFGRFKAITDPTVGNHEYLLGNDSAYRDFWGNIPDYYSFNAGGWHFISLNSNAPHIGVNAASAQYQWLKNDLANDTSKCTAVYYHHPYVSIGKEGSTPALADIWKLMAQYHVTLVINGHDHEYQRWVPLDGNGQPSPTGIEEFVVGTGGHSLTTFVRSDPRVAFSMQKTLGALRLELGATSANFAYINTSGATLDSGTISCQGQ